MATRLTDPATGEFIPEACWIVDASGCWLWQRIVEANGYGRYKRADGVKVSAHRAVYEQMVGSVPNDMMLDHLCRVRSCVNPLHLEPVTNAENQRRGLAARLDWGAVKFIRENYVPRHAIFGARALARRYGVAHEAVLKVIHQRAWVPDTLAS